MPTGYRQRQDHSAANGTWVEVYSDNKPSAADRIFIILGLGVISWLAIGALGMIAASLILH